MLEMRSTISSEVAGMASVKYMVTLTGDEREGLLAVVDRGRAPATQARHANILLAVDRGEHAGPGMTDAQAAARARIPPLRDSGPVAGRVGRTSDGVRLSAARYTGGQRRADAGQRCPRRQVARAPSRPAPRGGRRW